MDDAVIMNISNSLVAEEDCLLLSSDLNNTRSAHVHPTHCPLEQEDEDEEENVAATFPTGIVHDSATSTSTSLSWPLRLLFALNGLTLSLPSTALMYIINTRVALSLSLLPTYGAISFLPWSLKPLYAMALSSSSSTSSSSSSTTTSRISTTLSSTFCCCSCCLPSQRHLLISILLLTSALTTTATAWIPSASSNSSAVVWLFVLGFLRGVTGAWPEFLLGLALLQQATDSSSSSSSSSSCSSSTAAATPSATALTNTTTTTTATTTTYEECVAKFQAQAATARNVGSLLAHILASSLFLYWRHQYDGENSNKNAAAENSGGLNDWTVLVLFSLSGLFILAGAVIAFLYRVGSVNDKMTTAAPPFTAAEGAQSSTEGHSSFNRDKSSRRRQPRKERLHQSSSSSSSPSTLYQSCHTDADIERLQDTDRPHDSTQPSFNRQMTPPPTRTAHNSNRNNTNNQASRIQQGNTSSNNIRIVLLIQLCAILMTLRQLIINSTHTVWVWNLLLVVCCLSLAVSVRVAMTTTAASTTTPTHQHLVGLFLILRHVLPDAGFLMYSFVYDVVGMSSPLLLQFFSLSDMVIVTLASWSYGVLFASSSSSSSSSTTSASSPSSHSTHDSNHHGGISKSFKRLVMSMTILASVASLANLVIVHLWKSNDINNSNKRWILTVGITFLCNALMTWTSEWNFLPDVILASVSVSQKKRPTCATARPQDEEEDDYNDSNDGAEGLSPLSFSLAAAEGEPPRTEPDKEPFSSADANVDNELFLDEHNDSDETASFDSGDEKARQHQQQIGIEYGSFISCIDFGDQLGALVVGWIVGAMNITRENDWQHLDDLIILCAMSTAVFTVLLVRVLL